MYRVPRREGGLTIKAGPARASSGCWKAYRARGQTVAHDQEPRFNMQILALAISVLHYTSPRINILIVWYIQAPSPYLGRMLDPGEEMRRWGYQLATWAPPKKKKKGAPICRIQREPW